MEALKMTVRTGRYDVVLIDPLVEAIPVKDENDNAAANLQMLAFRDLARSTGAAVIVVHNSGHRTTKRSQKFKARGATARVDRADITINFNWRSDTERTLHVVKSRGSSLNEHMTVKFTHDFGYEVVESSAPSASVVDSFRVSTLAIVNEEAASGRSEVERKTFMERLNVRTGTAQEQALDRALRANTMAGALAKPRKGTYSLPLEESIPAKGAGDLR
jgi:hypothetical protein